MDDALRETLARVEDRHWWYEGRRRILARVLAGLGLPPDASILEIGCGGGANLAMLGAFGSVFACEPDPVDLERARARGFGPVEAGGLPDDIPFGDRPFDLVAVLDVLEHVDDDEGSLGRIRERTRPGGLLLATVPAHGWLWSRHDEANHHRRRYSRRELQRRMASAGFEPLLLAWFNTLLSPVAVAVRLLGGGSAGTGIPPEPVNRVLAEIFSSEAGAVTKARLPFGISLLAVARNPGTGRGPSRTARAPT